MGQRSNYATVTGAQILLGKEECASGMGQRSNSNPESNTEGYVLPTGAQIMLRKEECASDMGQRSNYAAAKDAQIKL